MNIWKQIPNATKVYLVIFIYLVLLLCGLIILRQYREAPEVFSFKNLFSKTELAGAGTQTQEVTLRETESSEQREKAWLRAKTNVRVLEGPGEGFPEIAWLEDNQEATIVGASEDGRWWVIELPYFSSGHGWVEQSVVEANNIDNVQVVTPVPLNNQPSPTSENNPKVKAIANINIRSGPDLKYQKIGTLEIEKIAEIVGVSPDQFWWLIKVPGTDNVQGWVSRDYVIAQNADNVPIVGSESGFQSTVSLSSAYLTVKATVNVRSGPDVTYAVIGQLNQDQLAEIVGKTADDLWWAIRFTGAENEQGWVAGAYVEAQNTSNVPVIP